MITVRRYTDVAGITEDYYKVRAFLAERGYCEFTYARWDWMTTHPNLQKEHLGRIGMWEDEGRLVALAAFDCVPGDTFLITLPGYEHLKAEMIAYAEERLCTDDDYRLIIPDGDRAYQSVAARMDYIATPEREFDAAFFPGETDANYTLPKGFTITDMAARFDLYQYGRVLWKGFNHELNGEGMFAPTKEDTDEGMASMQRANVELALKIAVVAPCGDFAAFCGMWYDARAGFAVIEPVACDPEYRRLGLAKAAVLEGIRRTAAMGAEYAVVGSNQQFYYSIGLRPYAASAKWMKRAK